MTAHIKKQHDTTKQEKCEVVAVPDSTSTNIPCLTGTSWPETITPDVGRAGGWQTQSVSLPTIAVGDIVLTTSSSPPSLPDQPYSTVAQEIFLPQSQADNSTL